MHAADVKAVYEEVGSNGRAPDLEPEPAKPITAAEAFDAAAAKARELNALNNQAILARLSRRDIRRAVGERGLELLDNHDEAIRQAHERLGKHDARAEQIGKDVIDLATTLSTLIADVKRLRDVIDVYRSAVNMQDAVIQKLRMDLEIVQNDPAVADLRETVRKQEKNTGIVAVGLQTFVYRLSLMDRLRWVFGVLKP